MRKSPFFVLKYNPLRCWRMTDNHGHIWYIVGGSKIISGRNVMSNTAKTRKVLIASSHPLFAQGLRRLLQKRQEADVDVLGVVSNVEQAIEAIASLNPDLVIVDYDDESVNREEFLTRFLEGVGRLRVVLLSLKEGGDRAVVYDRRNMAASQIEEWLEEWTQSSKAIEGLEVVENQPDHRRPVMKHWIGVTIFVVLIAAAGIFGLRNEWLLTQAAAVQAGPVDRLFSYHWILISVLFAIILGFMLYSFIFFRRKPGDETDAAHIEGNNTLEFAWTFIPLITVIGFAFLGSQSLSETLRIDPQAIEIKVIGQQWSWRFEYPEYGVTSNVLIMPIDKQALLRMESVDVLHSFWVPEFRLKQDLLPGQETQLRITPNRLGNYTVRCAEICGTQHAYMLADVQVVDQAEFDRWIISQTDLPEDPIERGAIYSEQYGCIACHSLDGTVVVGPSWQGVYQSQVTLTDGTTITADETYLRESILAPQAKIHDGFPSGVMPQNFGETLREDQINDIIEFIKSLQ